MADSIEPVTDLPPGRLVEAVTRTLRHEVGDLLQTVYSTVAILQERMPPDGQMERRFLADLRGRAETCKDELDAVHDLVLPMNLSKTPVDLAELAGGLAAAFATRHKSVEIRIEGNRPVPIEADAPRLVQVGRLLLAAASQSARRQINTRTGTDPATGMAVWSFADDGHGASPQQLQWLNMPFATTQQALGGLSLALARKVVELHGGRVSVENRPGEGLRVTLHLPAGGHASRY
jgi:signal transduction histidine kinase